MIVMNNERNITIKMKKVHTCDIMSKSKCPVPCSDSRFAWNIEVLSRSVFWYLTKCTVTTRNEVEP